MDKYTSSLTKVYEIGRTPKHAFRLALLGLNNDEMAIGLGITTYTLETWLKDKPEFRRAVNKGRQEADSKVVRALYKRACGYQYEDTHISVIKDSQTQQPIVVTTPVVRHQPPDVQAAIFWLTNRQRDLWTNTSRVEHSGKITFNMNDDLTDLTDAELSAIKKIGLAQQALKSNN